MRRKRKPVGLLLVM